MAEKNFLDEEMLDDEQLDQVAGGYYGETAEDSEILSCYGLCNKYDAFEIFFDSSTKMEDAVKAAWAKVGVGYEYYSGFNVSKEKRANKYFLNGKEISRVEAYKHLVAKFGQDPLTYRIQHQ